MRVIESNHRLVFFFTCIAVCYCVFLYFYFTANWLYISVPGLVPSFADLLFILAGSDCTAMGIDVVVQNPCDPWGRAHNYGLFWLQVGRLGVTREDITWLALSINAIFLLLAVLVISPASIIETILALSFLISPAIMLGLERANADLIIFSLLALSFYCVYSRNHLLIGLGCLVLFLTAILKLYPIVIVVVLVFYFSANRIKFGLLMATLLMFFLYLFLNWSDVTHLMAVIPNITWHYSMGGELLFSRLGFELNDITRTATYCLGALSILAGIAWGCRATVFEHDNYKLNRRQDWISMLYLSAAVLVVFSFLIKNSFDYRNVFFIFLLPYLFWLIKSSKIEQNCKRIAFVIVMVCGFLFWAEFFVSIFHNITLSGVYIRILESILNWLIVVPIVMLAMQIAIINPQKSWLISSVVKPLQKIFGKHPDGLNL